MLRPLFENFPTELKQLNHWVVWKGQKVPYDPTRPNTQGNVTDASTWGSFCQAEAAYSEGGWDGEPLNKPLKSIGRNVRKYMMRHCC
jgi:primase-polymerase (primpol)-like protein